MEEYAHLPHLLSVIAHFMPPNLDRGPPAEEANMVDDLFDDMVGGSPVEEARVVPEDLPNNDLEEDLPVVEHETPDSEHLEEESDMDENVYHAWIDNMLLEKAKSVSPFSESASSFSASPSLSVRPPSRSASLTFPASPPYLPASPPSRPASLALPVEEARVVPEDLPNNLEEELPVVEHETPDSEHLEEESDMDENVYHAWIDNMLLEKAKSVSPFSESASSFSASPSLSVRPPSRSASLTFPASPPYLPAPPPSRPASLALPASPASQPAAPKAVEYALTLSDDDKHAFDKLGLQLAFLDPVEFFRMCTILSEAMIQPSEHQGDVHDFLNKTLYFYSDASFFRRIKAVVVNHNLKHNTQLKEADLLLHVQDNVRHHLEDAVLPTPTFTNRRQLLAASDANFINWEGPSKQETVNLVHSFSLLAAWHDSGQLRKGMCAAAVWKQSQKHISQNNYIQTFIKSLDSNKTIDLQHWSEGWIFIYGWPRTLREHLLLEFKILISMDIYMMTRVAIYQIEKNTDDFFRSHTFFKKTKNEQAARAALGINDESRCLLHHVQQNYKTSYDSLTQKNLVFEHFLHIAIIESLLLRSSDCAKKPFIFEDHFASRLATNIDGREFLKTCSPMTLAGTTPYIRLTGTPYSFEDVKNFLRSKADARLLVYSTETPGECLVGFESFENDGPVYRFERTKNTYTLVQRVNFTD